MNEFRWPQGITTDSTLGSIPFDEDHDFPEGVWFGPTGVPLSEEEAMEAVMSANCHVVVEPPTAIHDPGKAPIVEYAIATEDDLKDGCPACNALRERIRAGDEVPIVKMRWS